MAQITKLDIIVNLLTVNGPMTRNDLMREVARIEGKPFRQTSNRSYFEPAPIGPSYYGANRSSLVTQGYLRVAGKRGNTYLWGLTQKGCAYLITSRQNMSTVAATLSRLTLVTPV